MCESILKGAVQCLAVASITSTAVVLLVAAALMGSSKVCKTQNFSSHEVDSPGKDA